MKNTRRILIVFLIIAVLFGGFFAFMETNIFIAQKGSIVKKKISIGYEGVLETEVMLVQLKRNGLSMSAMDWAKFENGNQFIYVAVPRDHVEFEDVLIYIPEDIDGGKYHIDYTISVDGAIVKKDTLKFRVRSWDPWD